MAIDLKKFRVTQLRKIAQDHNKIIRTGTAGNYMPGLHKKKKADIIKFLKKNFRVTAHSSGGTQLKNKHKTHVLQVQPRAPRQARRVRRAQPSGDRDDEKAPIAPPTPPTRRRRRQASTPPPSPDASIPPSPAASVEDVVDGIEDVRMKDPKPKAQNPTQRNVATSLDKLTLGDMLWATVRYDFYKHPSKWHKTIRRFVSMYKPGSFERKDADAKFKGSSILWLTLRAATIVERAWKKRKMELISKHLATSIPKRNAAKWKAIKRLLVIN
jgi:hypothetical protein